MAQRSETGRPRYRSMSPDERQTQYSPSSAIGGNYAPFIEEYQAKSELAYGECVDVRTVQYGELEAQSFDIAVPVVSGQAAPVLVYLHGGYWQALSKRDSFFGAHEFNERAIAYVAVDYTLAPHAQLRQIVDECRAALTALGSSADDLGIDPGRVYIAGSSAGAHLAAMCCAAPGDSVQPAGAILLSGIYDLEPFVGITDNEAVGLDLDGAAQLSPLLLAVDDYPDTIVSWGENETDEFKRQSQAMGERLRSETRSVDVFESPARNHFDVVHDLVDLTTPLGLRVQSMIDR